MAYDEKLAERIRRAFEKLGRPAEEKKMFGGLCFLLGGAMACGILKDEFIVRVGVSGHENALKQPGARPFDFSGRVMRGFVYVSPEATKSAAGLRVWLKRGIATADASLKKKAKKSGKKIAAKKRARRAG